MRKVVAIAVFCAALAACLISVPTFSLAQQPQTPPAIQVQLTGEVRRGEEMVSVETVSVLPGELLVWQLQVRNASDRNLRNVSTDGLVPRGTAFVAGSARADGAALLYSIDGGRTFSPQPMVRVIENGVERERPADPATYTNIRFVWSGSHPAGATRLARYQTRVR